MSPFTLSVLESTLLACSLVFWISEPPPPLQGTPSTSSNLIPFLISGKIRVQLKCYGIRHLWNGGNIFHNKIHFCFLGLLLKTEIELCIDGLKLPHIHSVDSQNKRNTAWVLPGILVHDVSSSSSPAGPRAAIAPSPGYLQEMNILEPHSTPTAQKLCYLCFHQSCKRFWSVSSLRTKKL